MQNDSQGKMVEYLSNKIFKSEKCELLMHLGSKNENEFTKDFNLENRDFKWYRSSSKSGIQTEILKNSSAEFVLKFFR